MTLIKKDFSKATVLTYLKKIERKLKIKVPELIYFTKENYLKNKNLILNKIEKKFKGKKIIIRSSSLQEDQKGNSYAGKFKSFKNLSVHKNTIIKFIDIIIKDFNNLKDQIIVQEFISKPKFSGVIFTRNINNNAPYYIINIDKSGHTDLVTSGKLNPSMKTIIVHRDKINSTNFLKKQLLTVKKIENFFSNDRLDIEFCIKDNKFYILQCRSLKFLAKVNDKKIRDALVNISKKVQKIKSEIPSLFGETTYLSNMSDWNPAEMIGIRPTPLSISLYSEMITDEVWAVQRKNYGYKDVRPNTLMLNLGGSPYIDLRVDFNSFLPAKLPNKIQKKSIKFYLSKIKNKPELQDKIEFDIVETCYDFHSKERLLKFLTPKETNLYLTHLREVTNNIVNPKSGFLKFEVEKIKKLEGKINILKKSKISEIQKIYFYINDCKKFGTLPFAGLARCAFISTKILRSLVKNALLTEKELEDFYGSISTITKKMNVLLKNIKGPNRKNNFLKIYGHLRPSTYSISSKNYLENFNKYFSKKEKYSDNKTKKFFLDKKKIKAIDKIFKKNKLKFSCREFFRFAKLSIFQREYSKLIFTKSINEIFINMIKLSKEIKIKREDLEFISIKHFLNYYSYVDIEKLKKILKDEISRNKRNSKILDLIEFPEFVTKKEDLYLHEYSRKSGNYITTKKIYGKIVDFKKITDFKKLDEKIVLLENADPGYDFIFSHNIRGLITEYGGANSHMSIRCLELGIPAIIGVGKKDYTLISESNSIEINSKQKYYKILN